MFKKYFYLLYFINIFSQDNIARNNKNLDLNLIGYIIQADGLGQIALNIFNCLNPELNICISQTRCSFIEDLKNKTLIEQSLNLEKLILPNVAIFTDSADHVKAELVEGKVRLAYTMVEGTEVPYDWVVKLNNYFDAVIVPDEYLVKVYEKSGIKLPIFVLPLLLNLDEFLSKKMKKEPNKFFCFGYSAGFGQSKNHNLLIDAFNQEFRNEKNVFLKLHGRHGYYKEIVEKKLKEVNNQNISLINNFLKRDDYVNFVSSLDCYITLSKGEGFSITPREAMAAGIPCILSNNSAHKTICQTDFVYSINSNIVEPHFVDFEKIIGFDFNSSIDDVKKAMRQVYQNYQLALKKAIQAREWVKQYRFQNLKHKYLSLIKPKKIILGDKNIIEIEYIITNSKKLYDNYLSIRAENDGKKK